MKRRFILSETEVLREGFMGWIDYLLPRACAGCGDVVWDRQALCSTCRVDLLAIESPRCPRCALPREIKAGIDALCVTCLTTTRRFDAVEAAFEYARPVATALIRAKVGRDPSDFRALCQLAASKLDLGPFVDWPVVAVPMFRPDLRQRGFSTTQILCDVLQLRTRQIGGLQKISRTALRSKTRDERRRDVEGAFVFRGAQIPRNVLVVDDVLTTGATMTEVAKTLKRAGAKCVVGLVLARDV